MWYHNALACSDVMLRATVFQGELLHLSIQVSFERLKVWENGSFLASVTLFGHICLGVDEKHYFLSSENVKIIVVCIHVSRGAAGAQVVIERRICNGCIFWD